MSTWALRAAMVPVTRQMRAYFAPVNRTNEAPTIFDPGLSGVLAGAAKHRSFGVVGPHRIHLIARQ